MKKRMLNRFIFWAAFTILLVCNSFTVSAEDYTAVGIHFPPLMFEKDEKPAGFYYELLMLIQKRLPDVSIKTKFFPTPRMFRTVQNTPTAFALGIARIPERESLYKWVGPSIKTKMGLFKLKTRSDIHIDTEEDLKQYIIGTGRAYAFNKMLKRMGVPENRIQEVNLDAQNILKLYRKRIDLMATLDIVFANEVKLTDYIWDEFKIAYVMGTSDMYYAFNPSVDKKFLEQFENAFDQVQKTMEYKDLVNSYIPGYGRDEIKP